MFIARTKYYLVKIIAGWRSGRLLEQVRVKILSTLYTTAIVLWRYAALRSKDKRLAVSAGFSDRRNALALGRSEQDKRIFERISAAYSAAKMAQSRAASIYEVRGLWAEWIDVNYGRLVDALAKGAFDESMSLLENFCREQFAIGTGGSFDELIKVKNSFLGFWYVRTVWCDYRDRLVESGFDLSKLAFPDIGNPAGIPINGHIIQIDTLRHAYNAFGIRDLLRDIERPVVVEIGGGFGGQTHQTILQCKESGRPISKYLNFDLPEVQIVASYFLLKAFPDEKISLFGESEVGDPFVIGLFPHFSIDALSDLSADLVFNSHSFSEMDGACALHYLSVVNRVCRRYFMHINHEISVRFLQPDGTVSTNVVGSRLIPNTDHFKRIYKHPRVLQRPEDKFQKSFSYLYERIAVEVVRNRLPPG